MNFNKQCINCWSLPVCRYKDMEVRKGIKIEDTFHDCVFFIDDKNIYMNGVHNEEGNKNNE